jgi:putative transposase
MSTLQRAYTTELDLNHEQTTACRKHAGAARWAYNWGLARKQEAYRTRGKRPSAIALHRELNALKQTDVPWMDAVSKCAPQEALRNLDTACAHVFRRATLKTQGKLRGKLGSPRFKSRTHGLGSFRLSGSIVVFPDAVQLPRLGRLRLKERGYRPTGARVLSAAVSEQAGRWLGAVLGEEERIVPVNHGSVVGVDLGIKQLATVSDGTQEPTPRHVQQRLRQLKRCQRAVARKRQGSRNRTQAVRRLACLHRKIANQRTNTLQQLTSRLTTTTSVVVIEDVHVSGMLKNHHLAQAIGDVGFGAFRRQLTDKAAWYGGQVLVASRWEPTSKTGCACGWRDDQLPLADRTFRGGRCGLVLDRDLNAAKHVAKLADRSSDSHTAWGGDGSGSGLAAGVNLSPLKQEPATLYAPAYSGTFWRTVE